MSSSIEVVHAAHVGPDHAGYYLLVFVAFVIALALNFLLCAGYTSWMDGTSLADKTRDSLIPLLSAQLFSALLTVAAVYVTHRLGVTGFILFGLVLAIFQYLIGELLTSKRRSDKLQRIATTDELTGLGNREYFSEVVQTAHRRRAASRAPGSRSCSWTSTASRRSTTRSGTTTATCCSASSDRA